jgi:hypothetical protein
MNNLICHFCGAGAAGAASLDGTGAPRIEVFSMYKCKAKERLLRYTNDLKFRCNILKNHAKKIARTV